MILKSKLSNKYPVVNPKEWLDGDYEGEDPIFLGRLAAYAKWCYESGITKLKRMKINTGIRTDAFQLILYNEAQNYKKTKKLGKYGVKSAAYPGKSYHSDHVCLAVDVDKSHPFYKATNKELAPFGLCKPLLSIGEVWHGQPIETLKLGSDASVAAVKAFIPEEVEVEDLTKEETLELIKSILAGTDIAPSDWAKDAWNDATKNKIIDGKNPKGYPTKEQVILMIQRAKEK